MQLRLQDRRSRGYRAGKSGSESCEDRESLNIIGQKKKNQTKIVKFRDRGSRSRSLHLSEIVLSRSTLHESALERFVESFADIKMKKVSLVCSCWINLLFSFFLLLNE